MKTITIIGGGASGTLLAINLIRKSADFPLRINLVERRKKIGRGVAFGTAVDAHLLNVPAGKMGAFPEDTEHFHRWLLKRGHEYAPTSFVPRRISLEAELADRWENLEFNLIGEEAADIVRDGEKAVVVLQSGDVLPSDRVVLAFGNFRPPDPNVGDLSFTASEKYFRDPWNPNLYERIDKGDSVFMIGTGLSMADVVVHLFRLGHKGKITAISTRGLLPATHKLGFTYPSFNEELEGLTRVTDVLKVVRKHIQIAEAAGSDWRAVIDSLRPVTQQLWLGLPKAEKRYFMQHLSRYWNVARHRMPMEAAAVLDSLQIAGRLEILKGRLKRITADPFLGFAITYSMWGEAATSTCTADVLINCIGSQSNYSRVESRLVQNLLASGQIAPDPLLMGLNAKRDGAIIDRAGRTSRILFTLGTALKGILWESTAIPEIRVQARQLSDLLLAL